MEEKVRCGEILVSSIEDISDKACKITMFYGDIIIIPKSQVLSFKDIGGGIYSMWLPVWLLKEKKIIYQKKHRYLNRNSVIVIKHIPSPKQPLSDNLIEDLKK